MVDIEKHKIVDLISSRDRKDVEAWLSTFPNIKIVSRDGSIIYRKAIESALPNALQVSDRFHLLKNLTDYCSAFLKRYFKNKVTLSAPEPINAENKNKTIGLEENVMASNMMTLKSKAENMEALQAIGWCKTKICKHLKLDSRTFAKLQAMPVEERNSMMDDKATKKHNAITARKQAKVDAVKELWSIGFAKTEIAKELEMDPGTVACYLKPFFSAVHGAYGKKRPSLLTPHMEKIKNCIEAGYKATAIDMVIRNDGYKGSYSSVVHYISGLKKRGNADYILNQHSKNQDWVSREKLIKLFYKPITEVKHITADLLKKIFVEYPLFEQVLAHVANFKKILMGKDAALLEEWLCSASNTGVIELQSYVVGIRRDLVAVKNAITHKYSNGLAEGFVNKLKVIKRIMYGRCSFETLRKKVLGLGANRIFN